MTRFADCALCCGVVAAIAMSVSLAQAQSNPEGVAVNSTDSFSVTKYVVQGVMRDDNDRPVEGAALHIGREVAFTDASGHFFARFSRRGAYPLSLAREEFVRNGIYAVLSAPTEVNAEPEASAADIQIVVRRIPPPQAKLYQQ